MSVRHYVKRPIVITAVMFEDSVDSLGSLSNLGLDPVRVDYSVSPPVLHIKVVGGECSAAQIGDYIIKSDNGTFHSCRPDIFHKTYQEVGIGAVVKAID